MSAREITREMLDEFQWIVLELEQIEITLKKNAMCAENLEEEKYPTGLLVVLTIFAVLVHYVNILNSPRAQEPMKSLTKILLVDYDKSYHPPTGNVGKVKFTCKPETGEHICYMGVHPYILLQHFLIHIQERG